MPDRATPRDRVESSVSNRNSDAGASLRAGVSDEEMRNYFKDNVSANRGLGTVAGVLGNLEIFDGSAQAQAALPPRRIESTGEFQQEALRMFSRIDTDGSRSLSLQEIGALAENRNVTGRDAQVVAALYDPTVRGNLVRNSEDANDSEISLADVQLIQNEERDRRIGDAERVRDTMSSQFAVLDTNNDDYVNDAEIDSALRDENVCITDQFRTMLRQVRDNYDTIRAASWDEWLGGNYGITRDDLSSYVETFDQQRMGRDAARDALGRARATHDSVTSQTSNELFPGGPEQAINPDAIRQQRIADCYFMASLAAVAQTQPDLIRNMVRENGNGTYTVTFPGDPQHPVTVAAPTETEMGLGNRGGQYGRWAGVVERAFGQWRIERRDAGRIGGLPEEHDVYPATITLEAAHGSSMSRYALRVLTGRDSFRQNVSALTDEQVAAQLETALSNPQNRRPVTAYVPRGNPGGFAGEHEYTVLAFERSGANDGYVTVRNPWGNGQNSREGTIRIRLAEFRQSFSTFTVNNQ